MTSPTSSALVSAARGLPVPHTPVWFMRQAGRSLPEYRALRSTVPMLQACRTPELVTEITLQPVRRHGVDAAIFFSDIVVPLQAAGIDLDIVAGVGPVVAEPVRDEAAVARIRPLQPEDIADITTSVQMLVGELGATPLIGFAGAPFTLASYLIEGGPSKDHALTKSFMKSQPELWHRLASALAQISGTFLRTQVDAGASVVQLFDSWAGTLSRRDYEMLVAPHSAAALAYVADVPRISFGVGTGELLGSMAQLPGDVVGVDFRVSLADAADRVGPERSLQGNLDPALLGAPWEVIAGETDRILAEATAARGHIFNLGHGVPPSTDPDVLTRLTAYVHEQTEGAA